MARLATLILIILSLGSTASREDRNVIEEILLEHPEWFADVLERADEHRLQILYTQIDRDENNHPVFTEYPFRVTTEEYFYPASTVKLPAAILALEKLHRLDLGRDTSLRIEAGTEAQTAVERDPSKEDGLPTVAHYVKKIFLVSDNDAYNRLFELLGQRQINEALWEKGFEDVWILRRLESGMSTEENRITNPVAFYDEERELYRQPLVENPEEWKIEMHDVRQGRGYLSDGELIPEPLDFIYSNYLSVESLQGILKSALFPEAVPEKQRFDLREEDARFLYRAMSMLPRESEEPVYDPAEYYDSYVKYFLFGDSKEPIPDNIRIFNKPGQAYGYLIDNAYVVDFEAGVEFLLTAVIQTNANQIYNDDTYEYDEIGVPFLANLGRAIYAYELDRPRPRRPDLSRFDVHGWRQE